MQPILVKTRTLKATYTLEICKDFISSYGEDFESIFLRELYTDEEMPISIKVEEYE